MSLDLPPLPPPQAPRPPLNRPTTLLVGCGLGMGAIGLMVVAGLIVSMFVLPTRSLPQTRAFVDGVYARAEANKNLTKQQLAVYREIADLVASPESGVLAVNVGGTVLYDHLKDGAIADEEIEEAQSALDDLNENLAGGAIAFAKYLQAHPGFQERFATFTRDRALSGVRAP